MNHCTDDDLILAYYGEAAADEAHLAQCGTCNARYRELRTVLELVAADDTPARGERYGLEVWQRIRHRLPEPEPRWYTVFGRWQWAAACAAAVVLIAVGFTAGRVSLPLRPATLALAPVSEVDDAARRRVLMLTVADHLERSERVLTDIVNASAGTDLSVEQQWADDLLDASRFYRHDAIAAQELSIVSVLDELERTLLEIVHQPSLATREDLEEMRRRIDSAALLFKVRVMSNELRELSDAAARPSNATTSTIG